MQHSKKYWNWPETYKRILHSYWTPQFQNFTIPPTWLSSQSVTIRYCYACITFSLHNFKLLPICQLEFLGLVIPLFFVCLFVCLFFGGGFRFLRNYVSILVNIISNNAVLQCYLLWIFVLIRRLLQLIVCIGVSTPPHLKNTTPSFTKSSLKSANYPSPSFLGDSPPSLPPPPKKFMHTSHYPQNRIFQWTPTILNFLIINPIPFFNSN